MKGGGGRDCIAGYQFQGLGGLRVWTYQCAEVGPQDLGTEASGMGCGPRWLFLQATILDPEPLTVCETWKLAEILTTTASTAS